MHVRPGKTDLDYCTAFAGKIAGLVLVMTAFAVLVWMVWPNPVMCVINGFFAGISFWRMCLIPVVDDDSERV